MRLPKIRIIQLDDWRAVYLDEYLYYQGHSIPDFIWVELIQGLGAAEVFTDQQYDNQEFWDRMPDTYSKYIQLRDSIDETN